MELFPAHLVGKSEECNVNSRDCVFTDVEREAKLWAFR